MPPPLAIYYCCYYTQEKIFFLISFFQLHLTEFGLFVLCSFTVQALSAKEELRSRFVTSALLRGLHWSHLRDLEPSYPDSQPSTRHKGELEKLVYSHSYLFPVSPLMLRFSNLPWSNKQSIISESVHWRHTMKNSFDDKHIFNLSYRDTESQ